MQNHLNLMNIKSTLFFDDNDVIIDGLISDSNESTSSTEQQHQHHHQHLHQQPQNHHLNGNMNDDHHQLQQQHNSNNTQHHHLQQLNHHHHHMEQLHSHHNQNIDGQQHQHHQHHQQLKNHHNNQNHHHHHQHLQQQHSQKRKLDAYLESPSPPLLSALGNGLGDDLTNGDGLIGNENTCHNLQPAEISLTAVNTTSATTGSGPGGLAVNAAAGALNSNKKLPINGKKTKGRVKIKMEFIDNKLRRYTTFSKRKTGIMKKAYELSTLTGTQVMLLVASETGHVYTFATRKLQPMITSEAGKALIQTCLNSPDAPLSGLDQRMSATGFEETDLTYSVNEDSDKYCNGIGNTLQTIFAENTMDSSNAYLLPDSISCNSPTNIRLPPFCSI